MIRFWLNEVGECPQKSTLDDGSSISLPNQSTPYVTRARYRLEPICAKKHSYRDLDPQILLADLLQKVEPKHQEFRRIKSIRILQAELFRLC